MAAKFLIKLPQAVVALPPSHPFYELSRAVLAGDAPILRTLLAEPGFNPHVLTEALTGQGINLLQVAAISNRPIVMVALLETIDVAQHSAVEAQKLEARREAVASSTRSGAGDHRANQLQNFDRLMHILSEQQFIALVSVTDASGRSALHYAAAARGVILDTILGYKRRRFQDATSTDGSHVPLFPPDGHVHPATGELWLPGDGTGPFDDSGTAGGLSPPRWFVPVSALTRARTDPAFIDARDAHGATALIYATAACDVRGVKCLLEHGADGYAATGEGLAPLDVCSDRVVRAALLPLDAAVHSACGAGSLVRAGVRSPARGAVASLSGGTLQLGETSASAFFPASPPRSLAASSGFAAVGSTRSSSSASGLGATAASSASAAAGTDVGGDEAAAQHPATSRARGAAAAVGAASLSLLVDSGADINGRTGIHLRAALHTAVEHAAAPVVELLLNAGALVDITDVNGCTPLHIAAEAGSPAHRAIARTLHAAGANVNATSSLRRSPLHFAVVAAGGRGGGGGGGGPAEGATAGSAAAAGDSTETADGGAAMIALLVELGAAVDAVDAERNSALHAAAKRGNASAVDALLCLGARPYAQNIRGHTALHLAAFAHHVPVIRQLCRWDAEVGRLKFIADASGRSAYDLAADPASRAALHTLFEACAAGRLDLAQAVAREAAALPPGACAPWLPVRLSDVTRVLRRSCLHAAVTGAARALARWRAEGGGEAAAVDASPAERAKAAAAARASAQGRAGGGPKPSASAVHTVAGIGLRLCVASAAAGRVAAGAAALPPPARCAWGGSAADVSLCNYQPRDEAATLCVDPYAYSAPPDAAAPAAAAGSTAAAAAAAATAGLATRRAAPGSELTSPQVEKEFGRVAEFLLRDGGARPDAGDVDGVTPVMLAARYGLLYLLRKLLTRGGAAAAAATDAAGNTALHWAYAFGHSGAAGIIEELAPAEVLAARNAAGRAATDVAAAGMSILPASSERLLLVAPPPDRSATLLVSRAV